MTGRSEALRTLIKKYYFPYQSDEAEHLADPPPNFGRGLRTCGLHPVPKTPS
jgi:hypothetical protein